MKKLTGDVRLKGILNKIVEILYSKDWNGVVDAWSIKCCSEDCFNIEFIIIEQFDVDVVWLSKLVELFSPYATGYITTRRGRMIIELLLTY